MELWNKHPKIFWREYNADKAKGTVKWLKKTKSEKKGDEGKKKLKSKSNNPEEEEERPFKYQVPPDYYD
jgi:hypothetical protein